MSAFRARPRVAFLGNMNNGPFALVRYLRDAGVDIDLLLYEHEMEHFTPAADSFDDSYKAYVRQLRWGSAFGFLRTPAEMVRSDVSPYEVLIGCGRAPGYLHKAGLALDIFLPFGDDIWNHTFYRLVRPLHLASSWSSVRHQRAGIRRSKIIHLTPTNALYEGQYERYRGNAERWIEGYPSVYGKPYAPDRILARAGETRWGREFQRIRNDHVLMIISHGRHVWRGGASDPNSKGTDRLLRGWSAFVKRHPGLRAALVTLEYGPEVEDSKALIAELGIVDSVFWFPKMYRKELMAGVAMADLVCAEFENSWICSGVIYEAMVTERPLLMFRDDSLYRKSDLYPILNAKEPEDIAARLDAFVVDRLRFMAMGTECRRWYDREVVARTIDKYTAYIAQHAAR